MLLAAGSSGRRRRPHQTLLSGQPENHRKKEKKPKQLNTAEVAHLSLSVVLVILVIVSHNNGTKWLDPSRHSVLLLATFPHGQVAEGFSVPQGDTLGGQTPDRHKGPNAK